MHARAPEAVVPGLMSFRAPGSARLRGARYSFFECVVYTTELRRA